MSDADDQMGGRGGETGRRPGGPDGGDKPAPAAGDVVGTGEDEGGQQD